MSSKEKCNQCGAPMIIIPWPWEGKFNCIHCPPFIPTQMFKGTGTVRPDWIILWVVLLERPWRDINRYRFFIFYFWFWIFEKTSKFWATSYKNASNPPTYWNHGLYGHIPQSFPLNRAPKIWEIQQLFFGLRLVCREFHHSAIQTKIENFAGFFHQIKVRRPIGRKDSKQPVIPTSRRTRCIFVWSGSELLSLLKYSRTKL